MSKRILIVEDESDLRGPLARRLSRAGHRVAEAENGLQALSLIHREPPNLVILDVSLPLFSGIETLRRLREDRRFTKLPVLMLTGVCDSETVHEILRLGVSQYLVKPCDGREIETTVHWILEKSQNVVASITQATAPRIDDGRTRILVAESNEEAMSRFTSSIEGSVFVARDGAEAVHAAWKLRPRIAFVSTSLPVVDGLEVIARLRALSETFSCAIVATALRTDLASLRLARQAGAHVVLEKPFEPVALRRLLARLLAPAESRFEEGSSAADPELGATVLVHPEIPIAPAARRLVDRLHGLAENGCRRAIVNLDPVDPPDVAAAEEIAEAAAFATSVGLDISFVARGEIAELLRAFRETAALPLHASIDEAGRVVPHVAPPAAD